MGESDPSERAQRSSEPLGARNLNPPDIGLLALVAEDFRTHGGSLLEPGFWAVALHRFGNWRMDFRHQIVRAPLTVLYMALFTLVNWLFGIHLSYVVPLGRRVRLWHHGSMWLSARSIGDDVHIRHNTTFGIPSRNDEEQWPTIEDRVEVGVGAVIIGEVVVGHDSVIGANSVVVRDVPPHSTVFGVPARRVDLKKRPDLRPVEDAGAGSAPPEKAGEVC